MANTRSAKKEIRASAKKREHNLMWKRRIKAMQKTIKKTLKTEPENTDILKAQQSALQKVVDKAAKENVIHKNKASRIKSRYAKRVTAHADQQNNKQTTTKSKSGSSKGSGPKGRTKKTK